MDDPLTEIARDGARRVPAAALRAEADAFVAQHSEETLPDGRPRVVRHGLIVTQWRYIHRRRKYYALASLLVGAVVGADLSVLIVYILISDRYETFMVPACGTAGAGGPG